jgi:hypothetical protein
MYMQFSTYRAQHPIERLNATFHQRLNSLARRTLTLVHQAQTLEAGMYVIGCLCKISAMRIKACVSSYLWADLATAGYSGPQPSRLA